MIGNSKFRTEKCIAKAILAFSMTVLLAGCGGGDGGDGGGAPPSETVTAPVSGPTITPDYFISPGAASRSYVTSFDEVAATAVRLNPEFGMQQRTVRIEDRNFQSFSFADVRAEYPLSAGLTGSGQLIAIVDDGYRLTHDELDGKTIKSYGSFGVEGHGTAVAAIAAGKWDGKGMMGIAPAANLHLSSFMSGFASVAAATRDAQAAGAVVQNNSWGYDIPITDVQDHLAANPTWSVARALRETLGGSTADMSAYLDALGAFTKQGVIVFAASNDKNATSATVMDGLPIVAPELGAGWLVAVSAIPQFQNDQIVAAERLSAGCLQMAHTCLTANGIVYSATASSDSSYQLWSGTSLAAPQISAGVALLAEAFPGLPANDIRRRLLASANNNFFSYSGWSDFGNGVVHGYNEEFGHGFMDLRAALLPIGATGLPATNNAYEGVTPLGSTYVSGGEPMGDAIARALASETIAVFDSLGADFRAPALSLYGESVRHTLSPRLKLFAAENAAASLSGGDRTDSSGWSVYGGEVEGVLHRLGLRAATTSLAGGPGSLAGLAQSPLSLGLQTRFGTGSAVSVYGFSSARPQIQAADPTGLAKISPMEDDALSAGAGLAWSHILGGAKLSIGASFLSEQGSALGMKSVGPNGSADALSGALDFAVAAPLPFTDAKLALSAQVGSGSGSAKGLLRGSKGTLFTSFGVSVEQASAFRDGDTLKLFARQPLRIESGTARLVVPDGRKAGGDVIWRSLPIDIVPSARQIDIGAEYATPLGQGDRVKFGVAFARDEGHVSGVHGVSVMGAFQRVF
jgi:hypothetical protein